MTQPAVNRQVQNSGEGLSMALTAVSEQFYGEARDLFTRADHAIRRVRAQFADATLQTGYVASLMEGVLPRAIQRSRRPRRKCAGSSRIFCAKYDRSERGDSWMSFPHPNFYHWLEPANLPSVRRHGLLSTERLLALANVPDDERQAILSTQRVGSLLLPGGVIVRDQSPIPPGALAKALPPGMTPGDWYRLLNRHVFLWASAERADRHRGAFRTRAALLLVFDAARLLAERGEEVFLSPINSGNARRKPSPRSERLFVPYLEWLETGWPPIQGRRRSRSFPPAEIVLRDHLPLEPYLVEIRVQDA